MEKNSINHILFDFNSIIDTDIGVALLMSAEYNNPNIVNSRVVGKSIEDYKILMVNRRYINPLIMFLNEQYRSSADELYMELTMTNLDAYKKALNMSIPTALFDLLKQCQTNASFEATVLCWNALQADYIKSILPNADIIIRKENKPVDVEKYDTIMLKFPYDMGTFVSGTQEMTGKNIYICKYRCNMNPEDTSKLNVTNAIKLYSLNANEIYVIDVYADAQLENACKEEINNG